MNNDTFRNYAILIVPLDVTLRCCPAIHWINLVFCYIKTKYLGTNCALFKSLNKVSNQLAEASGGKHDFKKNGTVLTTCNKT